MEQTLQTLGPVAFPASRPAFIFWPHFFQASHANWRLAFQAVEAFGEDGHLLWLENEFKAPGQGKRPGLKAVTKAEFKEMSMRWILFQTPIPFVAGLGVGIGLIIGLGISGQTFYTFVLENTRHLGTLKAMGSAIIY